MYHNSITIILFENSSSFRQIVLTHLRRTGFEWALDAMRRVEIDTKYLT